MKYNKTSFSKGAMKDWSFKDFKKTYESLLDGHDLKTVFAKLGGKQKDSE